jgi:hypothetical protein
LSIQRPPDDHLERGRDAFNRAAFFEAHEHWEEAWRVLEGPGRTVVQGLIQIAAALHHLQGGRRRPALALLRRGLTKLPAPGDRSAVALSTDALAGEVRALITELDGGRSPDLTRIRLPPGPG